MPRDESESDFRCRDRYNGLYGMRAIELWPETWPASHQRSGGGASGRWRRGEEGVFGRAGGGGAAGGSGEDG